MRERSDALLADADEGTGFARLAADPSRVGLESLLTEIAKLERLRVPRQAEVIDGLVELLIQVAHRITVKAERSVLEELNSQFAELCALKKPLPRPQRYNIA
jgi:hypothetical protein